MSGAGASGRRWARCEVAGASKAWGVTVQDRSRRKFRRATEWSKLEPVACIQVIEGETDAWA